MKKFLILLLTFITLLSVLSVSAFAEDSSAELSDPASSVEDSTSSEDSPSNDTMIPFDPSDDKEHMEKPMKPEGGKHEKPEGENSVPTIGAIPENSEAEEEKNEEGIGDVELKFTTENITTSLTHMGLGLLGVIIVLGLIAIVVVILNKASNKKE